MDHFAIRESQTAQEESKTGKEMTISVIHPSRNRPEKAKRAYDYWTKRGKPLEWILSIDADDRYLNAYYFQFKNTSAKIVVNANKSITTAVNSGARETTGDLLIVVSDDFVCPHDWTINLVKHLDGKSDFVARVSDGHQNWIVTLPIMDRVYYTGKGYMYNPAYLHMFCDTEMTTCAELEGKMVNVPMVFEHQHPMWKRAKGDAINERANKTWDQGMAVYLQRLKDNFGLKIINGRISDPAHIDWIKKHSKQTFKTI